MIGNIKHKAKTIYRKGITNLYLKPKWIKDILFHKDKYCSKLSYYPEIKQKSKADILIDQILQVLKYGSPNEFYFQYGFDVRSSNEMNEYLHFNTFKVLRDSLNSSTINSSAYILRDKYFFSIFTQSLKINSGINIAIIDHHTIIDSSSNTYVNADSFWKEKEGDYFIKLSNGECGNGIFHINVHDGQIIYKDKIYYWEEFKNLLSDERYIVQRTIEQHPIMAALHPQSLNTIRLVTIRDVKSGRIELFPSILRIGVGDSNVDNTSQGGIAVGINLETGELMKYGFYKPKFGGKVEVHPDSHITFSSFRIPHIKEAEQKAILLHSMLPGIHSIGWDIAIGLDGPVFVEGNDNWEITGPQTCNGPLKSRFETVCGIRSR